MGKNLCISLPLIQILWIYISHMLIYFKISCKVFNVHNGLQFLNFSVKGILYSKMIYNSFLQVNMYKVFKN